MVASSIPPERTLSEIGHFRDVGPAFKHYWINVSCLLFYHSSDVIDPDSVCVIGYLVQWFAEDVGHRQPH